MTANGGSGNDEIAELALLDMEPRSATIKAPESTR